MRLLTCILLVLLLSSCGTVEQGAVNLAPTTTIQPDALKIIDTGGSPLVVVEKGAVSIPIDKLGPAIETAASLASDNIGSPIAQVLQTNGDNLNSTAKDLVFACYLVAAGFLLMSIGVFYERVTDNKQERQENGR